MSEPPRTRSGARLSARMGQDSALRQLSLLLSLAFVLLGCAGFGPQEDNAAVSVDRSWAALLGAFSDEGLAVVREDLGSGVLEGQLEGIVVMARVVEQEDGSVRVDLRALGERQRDPGLLQRVVLAYDRRMGR